MGGLRAWIHFLVADGRPPTDTLIGQLARAGVTTYHLDPDIPSGPGIVVFDEPTPRLCDFLRDASHKGRACVVAVATSRAVLTGGLSWRLLQAGAADVFAWDHSATPATEITARFERWQTVSQLVHSHQVQDSCVGQSTAWIRLLQQVAEVAYFSDASVLFTGESGTGKEQVSRLIHALDQRPNKRDLVVLDCTTVAARLAGSEFFGHERGAFTGAIAARARLLPGRWRHALPG